MSVKTDLLKKIEATVKRKKLLSMEVSKERTIAQWVTNFFSEIENFHRIDPNGDFTSVALSVLTLNVRSIDKRCSIIYKESSHSDEAVVEIHWSNAYITTNNCEPVLSINASTATFERAMEEI